MNTSNKLPNKSPERSPKKLIDKIHDLLPKTQCTQCGFNGCKPYAEAIVSGTPFNQCPPGGKRLIKKLSELLNEPEKPLNPDNGIEKQTTITWIDEDVCIGCTKCIQACPVDAIIGAPKHMHSIIESECNGCNLCISPCPVDCIYTKPSSLQINEFSDDNLQHITDYYQVRFENKKIRLEKQKTAKHAKYLKAKQDNEQKRKDYIKAAIERVKNKK